MERIIERCIIYYKIIPGLKTRLIKLNNRPIYRTQYLNRGVKFINQYGTIYIDMIGQDLISGSTLRNVEYKLLKKFQNVYSSLKGEQPTANLDVSIGKLKSISKEDRERLFHGTALEWLDLDKKLFI